MASRFTYSIQISGFNKSVIVYDNNKVIYNGRTSSTSPVEGPNSLVSEAKLFLIDQYGPEINDMVKVNLPNQSNSKPTIEDNKKTIENIKGENQEKVNDVKKSIDDKTSFVNESTKTSPTDAKKAIIGLLLPLLIRFIRTEKIANAIINKIINDTKQKLKDKGRVEVSSGTITFTPKNPGDYAQFKKDFDRKVNNLKNVIKLLKISLDAILLLLRTLKAALVAFKVYLNILKARVASGDPTALPEIVIVEKKIDDYTLMIGVIQSILIIFQKLVSNLRVKLESLNLIINKTPQTPLVSLVNDITDLETTVDATPSEIEYTDGNKEYIIRVVTTPSGAVQAVVFDKFSMMKITQTAPSKIRKANELIEELKQILG